MTRLRYKENLLANLIGRTLSAVVMIVTVPIVIHRLGVEAYGLIGIYATLQAIFGLLDLGLSATMMREMARRVEGTERETCRDFARTIEIFYGSIGALSGTAIIGLSGFIVERWIHVHSISTTGARHAISLMGIAFALQWPLSLYEGGITGLQRQVLGNVVSLGANVIRSGAALVAIAISPSIQTYLVVQAAGYALQTVVTAITMWKLLPSTARPARFRLPLLVSTRRFATGISLTAVFGVALTQLDKITLTRVLDLKTFGFYAIACTAAAGLYYVIYPVYAAVYPELVRMAAVQDRDLPAFYHRATQLLALLLFPPAAVLGFFSRTTLLLWTRDDSTATYGALAMSLLVAGTALHGMMHIPYALQLAHGWTTLTLVANAAMTALVAPLVFAAARRYGATGAATVILLLHCAFIVIVVPVMHRRILQGETTRWFLADVAPPLAVSILTTALWRLAAGNVSGTLNSVLVLIAALITALLATIAVTPAGRDEVLQRSVELLRRPS